MNPNTFYPATAEVLSGIGSNRVTATTLTSLSGTSAIAVSVGFGYRGSLWLVPTSKASDAVMRVYYSLDGLSNILVTIPSGTSPIYMSNVLFVGLTNFTNMQYQFIGEKFTYV